MAALDDYPLFVAPHHLASKGRKNWNAEEATEYREWLIGVLDERVEGLKKRMKEPCGASPSDHLMALGEKSTALLMTPSFSEEGPMGRRLTNAGYALAADMGLLVAKYLFQALPDKLRWQTIRKPRSEMSYNLPVIVGFSWTYLDPVGGSIAEAAAVVRGEKGADVWKQIYEFWVAKG